MLLLLGAVPFAALPGDLQACGALSEACNMRFGLQTLQDAKQDPRHYSQLDVPILSMHNKAYPTDSMTEIALTNSMVQENGQIAVLTTRHACNSM